MRFLALALLASMSIAAEESYVPVRVFEAGRREMADFERLAADVSAADVVLVGEEHDDRNSHRVELMLLEALARRRSGILVGFEMFERDVQDPLDHFQMGHLTDDEFLKASRPWANYAQDYKPLVDFAIAKTWPVFASNAPHAIVTTVSKNGLDALKTLSGDSAGWVAKDLSCAPTGDYYRRFVDSMEDHPADAAARPADHTPTVSRQDLNRFFEAQCLRDETMGESIALAYETGSLGGKHPLVVHFNGSFHSDFREGAAAAAHRRLSRQRLLVITLLPVADLDAATPDKTDRRRADYLIYTVADRK
jgi:uncharacterized iron-regulated protein